MSTSPPPPHTAQFYLCRVDTGGQSAGSTRFSGVGDPTGFANAAPPAVPGLGGRGGRVGGAHFPVTTYATFETGALAKVEGKIRDLDAGMTGAEKVLKVLAFALLLPVALRRSLVGRQKYGHRRVSWRNVIGVFRGGL